MKSKIVLWTALTALIIASAWAEETNQTGIVSVAKDFGGKTTAVKLIVKSYDIKLDEAAKQLSYMDGERTTLVGALGEENGRSVVTLDPLAYGKSAATLTNAAPQGAVPFNETGMIRITKDAAGQVAAIELIADWRAVKLDEKSKPLEALDGRKVRITYDASFNEGLLPITAFELVNEAAAPGLREKAWSKADE